MVKMMPLSPSSLNLFAQCPLKYEGRYIKKILKWDNNKESFIYGRLIHEGLEQRLKRGPTFDLLAYFMQDAKKKNLLHCEDKFNAVVANTSQFLSNIDRMMRDKWSVYVEREAVTDGEGRSCGWWDDTCFMRAKIDVLLVSPNGNEVIIVDWKTGKASSINEFQLDFIALTLVPEFGLRRYSALDFLVDSGKVKKFEVEADIASPKYISENAYIQSKMCRTVQKIKGLMTAHTLNEFPATPSRLCRWCEMDSCQYAGGN